MQSLPELIKHVGRGARLARDLPRDEARQVMAALVSDQAHPEQVGGFLMAMRMKGESAEELAGFVDALRAAEPFPAISDGATIGAVSVDLHADGREGRPTLLVAGACAAAALGARVLLAGSFTSAQQRNQVGGALAALGLDPARGAAAAARAATEAGVGAVNLASYAPRVADLLALRARLGVRTCVNSAVKLLDPAGSGRALVGIFHGPYHAPVGGAARLLGMARAAIVQAPGGLPELSPDKPTRASFLDGDALGDVTSLDGYDTTFPACALPPVDDAGALAALNRAVLTDARAAPAGAARAAVLDAALILWAAGDAHPPGHPEVLARCAEALLDGRAAHVLDRAATC